MYQIDENALFKQTFMGEVKEGHVYYDPWNPRMDKTKAIASAKAKFVTEQLNRRKALTSSSPTFAAGNQAVLYPLYVDPDYVDLTIKQTPLLALTRRRAVKGLTYSFIKLSAIGNSRWMPEDSALQETTDTESRTNVAIKFAYSKGRITGQADVAMAGFLDASNYEMYKRMKSLLYLRENTLINGNTAGSYASTTPYNGVDAYDGLRIGITTNATSLAGAAVDLPDIRTILATIWNANGNPRIAVTDGATHGYLKGLLMDFQRSIAPPTADMPFGIPDTFSLDGVNFIKSKFMPTSSGSREILFLDPDAFEMPTAQDMTYQELAIEADSRPFYLKVYEALALKAETFCGKLTSIL